MSCLNFANTGLLHYVMAKKVLWKCLFVSFILATIYIGIYLRLHFANGHIQILRQPPLYQQLHAMINFTLSKGRDFRGLLKASSLLENVNSEKVDRGKIHCRIFNWSQPSKKDSFRCVPILMTPATPICVHDIQKDVYISKDIVNTGMWHPQAMHLIRNILLSNKGMGFIDIGSNIGFFSLIASRMGHKVVAVEPFIDNIILFQRSVKLNNLENRIVLVQNAISNERKSASLRKTEDNQGRTFVVPITRYSENDRLTTIVLDDLLEAITFKEALMKMDIEGYEHRAIVEGTRFLAKIRIPYIIMEWVFMKEHFKTNYRVVDGILERSEMTLDKSETNDTKIAFTAMNQLIQYGYSAFSMDGKPLKTTLLASWPEDVVWVIKDALKPFK